MKLTIDTEKKTIYLNSDVNIQEFINLIGWTLFLNEIKGYTIITPVSEFDYRNVSSSNNDCSDGIIFNND